MGRRERPTIMGNWKMHKTKQEALDFVRGLGEKIRDSSRKAYLAVPFTYIDSLAKEARKGSIAIGAQNMNDATQGAFTGEIAAHMLLDVGAQFVLLGHSERRSLYGETDALIQKKLRRALDDGLPPVLCVGETLKEHESGQKEEVLRKQLVADLQGVTPEEAMRLFVAYEPVWAIGTGYAATPEMAQETHKFCRSTLKDLFGEEIAAEIPLLYGGSVKPENATQLLEKPDIDGLLIGGASLSLASFSQIVNDGGQYTETE